MYRIRFLKIFLVVLALALWAGTAYGQGSTLTTNPPTLSLYYSVGDESFATSATLNLTVTDSQGNNSNDTLSGTPTTGLLFTCTNYTFNTGSPLPCTISLDPSLYGSYDLVAPGSTLSYQLALSNTGTPDNTVSVNVNILPKLSSAPTGRTITYTQGNDNFNNTAPSVNITASDSTNQSYTPDGTACPPWLTLSSSNSDTTPDVLSFKLNYTYADNPTYIASSSCQVKLNDSTGATFQVVTLTYAIGAAYTAPGPPNITATTPADSQITLTFTQPASNGGATIDLYTATCGSQTATAATVTPITVTGLTDGTAYNCTLTATNSATLTSTAASAPQATPNPPATSYSFTEASTGGILGSQSGNFTVTPNGLYAGTITIQITGGGVSPSTETLNFSLLASGPQTFKITPTIVGQVSLASSHTGTLTGDTTLTYNTPSGAPTSVVATPGNQQISVAFMAPANLGGASGIVSYKATCGAQNTSGAASPLVVTGLTNGTSYTCSVTANNGVGDSAPGQATATIPFPAVSYQFTQAATGGPLGTSGTFTITPNAAYSGTITIAVTGGLTQTVTKNFTNSATPATFTIDTTAVGQVTLSPSSSPQLGTDPPALNYNTPPAAPNIASAAPGDSQITLTFTAPANNGGAGITLYTATCGSKTATATTVTPITVTGLANGTSYSCTLTAANSAGTGAAATATSVSPSPSATTYTFSLPTGITGGGGPLGPSGNFTLQPNGLYSGNIFVTVSGGGLSTIVTKTWNNSSSAQTFTITPSQVGPVSLSPSSKMQLIDPVGLNYNTPPAPPTVVMGTPQNASISVAFTPTPSANNGGSLITSYTATCGTQSTTGAASPLVVSNLTNGTSYTCSVTATNGVGTSGPSAVSTAVSPAAGILTAMNPISLTYKIGTEASLSTTVTPVANQDNTAYVATSNKTWLVITNNGGAGTANTSATGGGIPLTFTVNPALVDAMGASTTSATISLAVTGGAPISLTVNLNVVASTLTMSSSALPMSYANSSNNAVSGTTTLTSNNDGVNFTANSDQTWLTVSSLPSGVASTAATGATVITYSVAGATAQGLGGPGQYTAHVRFYITGVSGVVQALVTVTLTVAPASTVTVSASNLSFTPYIRGSAALPLPVTTNVLDSNSSSTDTYTIGTTPPLPGWLQCLNNAGTTSGTVSSTQQDTITCKVVQAGAPALNAGPQSFPVHLQVPGEADVIFTVNFTMTTTTSPLISNPPAITLTYLTNGGGSQALMTTSSNISTTDTQYDNYTVSVVSSPTWLQVSAANSKVVYQGTPDTLTFKGIAANVPVTTVFPTSYQAVVKLSIPNNADLQIVVTLNVISQSMISTPSTVSLTYIKGGGGNTTSSPKISVVTATPAPFSVDASTVPLWLTVTPPSPETATQGAGVGLGLALIPNVVQAMNTGNYTVNLGLINSLNPGNELIIPINLSISNSAATLSLKEGTTTLNQNYAKNNGPAPSPTWTPYSSDEPIPFTAACTLTTSETSAGYTVVPGNGAGASCILSSYSGTAFTLGYLITATLDNNLFNGVTATYGNTVTVTVTISPQTGNSVALTYIYTLRPVQPTITSISPAYVAVPASTSTNDLTVMISGTDFVAPGDIYNGNISDTQVWFSTSTTPATAPLSQSQYVVLNDHQHVMITIPPSSIPAITKGTTNTLTIALGNQTSSSPAVAGPSIPLTVTQAPVIYGITSTASFVQPTPLGANPDVAAYDLVSIFGDQFLPSTATVASATAGVSNTTVLNPLVGNKVPTSLMVGGTVTNGVAKSPVDVSVTFTSTDSKKTAFSAPLLFANQNQINAIVPSGMTIGSAYSVTVTSGTATSAATASPVTVVAADPGIFTLGSDGSGPGAIVNVTVPSGLSAPYSINGSNNPVTAGDTVSIYLTGLGAPDSTGADSTSNTGCVAISNPTAGNGYLQIVNKPPASTGATAPTKPWTNIDGAVIQLNLLQGGLPPCMTDPVVVTFGTGPTAVSTTSVVTNGVSGGVGYAGWTSGSVAGLFQINTVIPANAGTGNIPIQVTITPSGGSPVSSPVNGATIYLQ